MSEEDRIQRALEDTRKAHAMIISTDHPAYHQAAWEHFVISWMRGFNLTQSYLKKRPECEPIAKMWFNDCRMDSTLRYIWEAGNVERHDSEGSSISADDSWDLNAIDPSQGIQINSLEIDGDQVKASVGNGVWNFRKGFLQLRAVRDRSGNEFYPPSENIKQIASKGLLFIESFRRVAYGVY